MEMDLKNIIDKIKQEGVEEAKKEASDIVSEAEKKAENILREAERKKEEIIKKAEQESTKLRKNSEEAIKQASRDALLSLRDQIIALFDKAFKQEVSSQLSPEALKEMIVKLAERLAEDKQLDIEVLMNEKEKKSLEKIIASTLKKETQKKFTIKTSPSIEHGFRIGEKDKHSYYDFNDEAIAEAFMAHLNPKIVELLAAGRENG